MNPRAIWNSLVVLILAMLGVSTEGYSQRIRLGVKAGVPLARYFDFPSPQPPGFRVRNYSSATRRYTVGPSMEMSLFGRYSLEFDALYKRIGYAGDVDETGRFTGVYTIRRYNVKGSSWDFPMLVKVRFGPERRVYVLGGGFGRVPVHLRTDGYVLSENFVTGTSQVSPFQSEDAYDFHKPIFPGALIGGGVELRLGKFRVSPEFRYTP